LDRNAEGPDHALSADPKTLKDMVNKIKRMEKILGKTEMRIRQVEKSATVFRRVTK